VTLLKNTPLKEDPELKAKREAEAAAWKAKQEEAVRLAVPRDIERLRKEAAERIAEADKLEAMLKQYPNLRKRVGRWEKVAYYTSDVNTKVDRFDIRHNCGCCNDSPLEIWPYLETPIGKVYSDPPDFRVGQRDPCYGGDVPYEGWDTKMREAGLPEMIIGAVSMHFKRCADEAREGVEEVYGDGSE
jgi:hypothetical protein